jgi:hypothetical protein
MRLFPLYKNELEPGKPPKRIREEVVICSFGSGGFTRLHKYIPYLRAGNAGHTLVSDKPFTIHKYGGDIEVPRQAIFHVFESTPRLLALGRYLQTAL